MNRKKLLKLAQGPKTAYPHNKSVVEVFEEIVNQYPDHTALRFRGLSMSYQELNHKANQLARHLRKLGVKKQDFVGIYLERSIDLFVGILAILKAGGIYVPIDASYPMERKLYMIDDTKLKVLITSGAFESQFPQGKLKFVLLDDIKLSGSTANLNLKIGPMDLAYVNYTSGTTGNPKGVQIYHQAINRLVIKPNWIYFATDDRFLQISNISFDALTHELWGALLNGATLCIYPQITLSSDELGKFIVQEKITQIIFTARLFNVMVDEALDSLQKVRYICSVGDVMSAKHARIAFKNLPSCHLINACGHTENTTHTTAYTITNTKEIEKEVPIGHPISNTTAYVLDEERNLVSFGKPGELYAGGDGVAKGYLNRKKLTDEKFVPNPFGKGKLYRTGDLVHYLPDGNISYLGRIDTQVKIRGFRIELSEIEEVIRKSPGVSDCIVIAREDIPGEKELVAYVESKEKKQITQEQLRKWVSSHLPAYMIPSFFVVLEFLPMTPNGKVDRKALPAPAKGVEAKQSNLKTETEKTIGEIWSNLLHRSIVDRNAHFFKIGGDSIRAMQVVSQLKKSFGQEVSTSTLFQHPILADLAARMDGLKQGRLVTIPRRKKGAVIPLSFNQESMWLINKITPQKLLYMVHYVYRIKGKIDVPRLKRALQKMIERHEILRTHYEEKKGITIGKVEKKCEDFFLQFKVKNEEKAFLLLKEKMAEGMDLTKLPLLQVIFIHIPKKEPILAIRVHHTIFDILSYENFFKEWIELYQAKKLAPLSIQYGDYAVWQREWIKRKEVQKQIEYWKGELEGTPDLLELPWDKPRPPQFTGRGDIETVRLSKELADHCKSIAQKEGVTPFVFFLAAFQSFLYRYSGKEDLTVGTPYANRTRPELEPLIGYFLQIFIIRSKCEGSIPFVTFLQNVNQTMSNAYKNSDVPLDLIIHALNPARNPSFNPLFQVLFVYENITQSVINFNEAHLHALPCNTKTSKFDLTLFIIDHGDRLECRFEYCTDLFEKETIQRMLSYFHTFLKGIIQNDAEKIGDLPILNHEELHQVVVDWNQVGDDYPKDETVSDLFEKMADQTPHQSAVRFKEKSLTYKELNEKGNQLARYLQKLGVQQHDFVGVYLERSDDLIVAALAIMKAGAVFVPIDASYPMERKLYMIENTGLKVLITERSFAHQFPEKKLTLIYPKELDLKTYSKSNLNLKIDSHDLAYINYTSGSTGKPKGVEYPHLGLVRLLKKPTWIKIGKGDRILQVANISFDMFAAEVWGALLNGATVCIYPQIEFSPIELGQFIENEKITHLYLTARLFNLMVEEGLGFLRKVRFFGSTGDVMSAHHAHLAFEKLPSCKILNIYGPTENHITTTYTVKQKDLRIPIGRPVQGTQVYVLDAGFKPAAVGAYGELFIGGEGLARGYLNNPKQTADKFIPSPFGSGLLYRTGDLVRFLPSGNLDYLGRIDTQVKILGFRIELDEVEGALRHYLKIADCIAIAKEIEPLEKRLIVYIEPKEGEVINEVELREYLASKLPKHSMPSYFVFLKKFPLTPNGKIDRSKLPEPASQLKQTPSEKPVTPTEKKLAKIWSILLKVPTVGRQDQFFHIGGHSILAMQLNSKVRKEFNVDIPVSVIFENSTLEKYALSIDQALGKGPKKMAARRSFAEWRDKEAVLDGSIQSKGLTPPLTSQYTRPKKIFLTGATGFVGAFFLKELLDTTQAKVYCLVRADSEKEALERLIKTLKTYLIWKPSYKNRIVSLAGYLEKPLLGLSPSLFHQLAAEMDSIFHIGAFVNHAMSYEQHKPANVLGTQEVIRLASTSRLKPLQFISTVAVVEGIKKMPIAEDADIEKSKKVTNGYVESKWVAEKLVLIARSRGIPCNILRLPRVSGDTKKGAGPTGDFLWRMVQVCLKLKMVPRTDLYDDLTPVDYICKAMHIISTQPQSIDAQYHVVSPYQLSYSKVFEFLAQLKYRLKKVDFLTWRQALLDQSQTGDAGLQALASLLADTDFSKPLGRLTFATDHLKAALKSSHLKCPKIDQKLFNKYVKYYVEAGFLPSLKHFHSK